MVRRSDRVVGEATRKASVGSSRRVRQQRGKRNGADDDLLEVQERGALNLNNPLIPPELDEDIDDDIAFNSDDEEKYGHLFHKKEKSDTTRTSTAATGGKKKNTRNKRLRSHAADADDMSDADDALLLQQLRALGEIDEDEDLDFHEGGGNGADEDDYIDLADMLDAAQAEEGKTEGKARRKKATKKVDESGVAKKRRRAIVTEEVESLYGPTAVDGKYSSAIREVVTATPASSTRSRMQQSLENKRNLISVDVDDHTMAKLTRAEVRKVVSNDLSKYNSFLREQREAKHVQLPMPMPESNPVPTTLGAISAAAVDRFTTQTEAAKTAAALTTATTTGDTAGMACNASRVSAFRLAGKISTLLSSAGLSRPELSAPSAEDGVIPLGDIDDDDAGDTHKAGAVQPGGDTNAPTTSYIAKLKAMLSYENARRRRLNRIKSKTYRRILRKEKDRERERREKAFEILHPEKARARLAEKLMKARVEERVTQKHKNTSKWVRHAKRFANFDDNTKDALNEQNLLHQRLMQKMEEDADEDAYMNAGGDAHAESEAASSEEERVVDYLIAGATAMPKQAGNEADESKKKKLSSLLWRSIEDVEKEEEEGDGEAAGSHMTPTEKARVELRGMKFMQQAKQREEKHYAEVLEHLQEDIRCKMSGETVCSDDEPSDLDETREKEEHPKKLKSKSKLSTTTDASVGRKAFLHKRDGQRGREVVESIQLKRHRGINIQGEDDESERSHRGTSAKEGADDTWSISEEGSSSEAGGNDVKKGGEKAPLVSTTNPIGGGETTNEEFAGSRQPNTHFASELGSDAAASQRRKHASSTRITLLPADVQQPRSGNGLTEAGEEGVVKTVRQKRKRGGELGETKKGADDEDEIMLQQHQDYLIARAFAHDEVDAEFLAEKTAQVETIMKPVDKNATLPGWGEWGGEDERLNQRHQAKLQSMELQRQIEKTTLMKSRADADLDHVIINHDGVELVPDRMLLHMIPRPFSNPTEFARSMRHPLGPEWNSAVAFKDANQPRLEVRQGHAVLPLDLSLRGKKKMAKTKRRKISTTAAV
ncbi:U3 small nucleolar RNA-associated protein 14 [Trypanosoma rangeli]|uniref:U3 small nucleolar RNA-associated protein 14 n=1 Tax=Trypanosoma rangeli TaxID=5698 RepID=A0A422P0Z6_TRYRA|nr:U3 small nucleolar RNA-associated protein 14 [Trypanosoma rangeli]RNF11378.1 U3 small nucleolar RNA-associated protein 14 [Trypanosoma rangeli]|eukprot:RNF11378.1 U3 small nucleolar RNA-associated protein 14 [Trypanosoma rangeli]